MGRMPVAVVDVVDVVSVLDGLVAAARSVLVLVVVVHDMHVVDPTLVVVTVVLTVGVTVVKVVDVTFVLHGNVTAPRSVLVPVVLVLPVARFAHTRTLQQGSAHQANGQKSWVLLVAGLEQSHHLGDALCTDIRSSLRGIDPAQPALAVELRQRFERRPCIGP